MRQACGWWVGFATVLGLASGAMAETAKDAYRVMGIESGQVLSGTTLNASVLPGGKKQVVCLTTYLTGKKESEQAVNVRLDVFRRGGDGLIPIYSRDFGADSGGHVSNGDLELLDLNSDGQQEIIVSYDSFRDPLIEQRFAQIMLWEGSAFRTAWAGPVEYDATRAVRDIPAERRDRYTREFDYVRTLRTRGRTLFIDKRVISVAGERLAEPKVVQETFPLGAERGS